MARIYFKDFLTKASHAGIDISKITFSSERLETDYRIVRISGGFLECVGISKKSRKEGGNGAFKWGSSAPTWGLYKSYYVINLKRKPLKNKLIEKDGGIVVYLDGGR